MSSVAVQMDVDRAGVRVRSMDCQHEQPVGRSVYVIQTVLRLSIAEVVRAVDAGAEGHGGRCEAGADVGDRRRGREGGMRVVRIGVEQAQAEARVEPADRGRIARRLATRCWAGVTTRLVAPPLSSAK